MDTSRSAFVAVGHPVGDVLLLFEAALDVLSDGLVVFDHEQLHAASVGHGQGHAEHRGEPGFAAHVQLALMIGDDAVADGQPEPGAARRTLGREERVEDLGQHVRRDAGAVVLELRHGRPAVHPGAHRDVAVAAGGIGGVEQDRHRRLDQPLAVAEDGRHAVGEVAGHLQSAESLVVLEQVERALEQRVEVGGFEDATGATGAREVEQPVDDVGAAGDLALDDLEILADHRLGTGAEARGDRRDAAADGRERVVDLVHHAGGELADGRRAFRSGASTAGSHGFR